ncbi:MAG: zinc-dependent metalloprotease [Psychroflexus sp.]|nr:zinc-dependent metalloprotease [Psychroflexus sp.]
MRLFFLAFVLFFGTMNAQNNTKDSSKKIDEKLEKLTADKGMITTYFGENSELFFEIPENLLNKDLLMVTRLRQLPANYSAYRNAGSKTSEQMIHFQKKGNRIDMIQVSTTNIADDDDPILISVQQNNFNPILASFKIEKEQNNSYIVDVSKFYNDDSPSFNIIGDRQKKEYKISGVDKSRSRIDEAKSFPENTEIIHTLTYKVNKPPRGNSANTFTFQINHSIIKLPEDLMPIRYADSRVGWFSLKKYNYSSDKLKSDSYTIAKRWRLEPKDKKAYANGELVEPVKPIVYYLDPATPTKWIPYFIKGIEDWNKAFNKIGFKNAIIAKVAPTKEEDPDFSPEDVRYSTVRYVASTTRNAVGPSVADPRTGEIIESDIIWYHNHLRSYRNRYLLETGAANPKARTLDTPEEEIGEMMRRVISHEIGHALGLPHNMKASSAYPVDSLRSGEFTQEMGIAASIMDYARYNYVAQPGDKNIRFIRKLGEYDMYAIDWGYRYFDKKTPEEIKTILKAMVDEKSTQKIYMFGGRNNDPDSQTESIGDDPIKASSYGLSNLKIVAQNLDKWTTPEGENYDELEELYGELLSVYRRYVYHVSSMIGGVHETLLNKGQDGTPYKVVSEEEQLQALAFLKENVWTTQNWLMPEELVSKFSSRGTLNRVVGINTSLLKRLLSTSKLNAMLNSNATLSGKGLNVMKLMKTLSKDIMDMKKPDLAERQLQAAFVNHLIDLSENKKLAAEAKAYVAKQKKDLRKDLKKKQKNNDDVLAAHFLYLHDVLRKDAEK